VHLCVSRHRSKSASVLPSEDRLGSMPFIFATRLAAARPAASCVGPQCSLRRVHGITSKASWFVPCNRGSAVQHLSRPARAARPASLAVSTRSSAFEQFNFPASVYRARAPSCTMNRMNTWAQGCASSSAAVGSGLAKNGCGSATRSTPNHSFKRTCLRQSA